ncbi:MAG: hypothetical protein K2J32_01660 [Ruminococcus sp.]|nr:hypothetical protein [Ruminococcus sp.]
MPENSCRTTEIQRVVMIPENNCSGASLQNSGTAFPRLKSDTPSSYRKKRTSL